MLSENAFFYPFTIFWANCPWFRWNSIWTKQQGTACSWSPTDVWGPLLLGKGVRGLKCPPTWPLLLRDWKASLYTVCIQVYCIQVYKYTLYADPPLSLCSWFLGVSWSCFYSCGLYFPLYYSLLLVLCVVHVLSGPQKFNYYSYFLKLSFNYFQDFVLRKENSVWTCFLILKV